MADLGRTLVVFGILIVAAGAALMFFGRLGLPRLPGDIVIRRGSFTLYFPLVTSLLLSLALTVVLNLLFRRR